MFLDLNNSIQVESFCQKGTRLMSLHIQKEKINLNYDSKYDNEVFLKQCPIIISADIAATFTPVMPNVSLIVNGFYASKVLRDFAIQSFVDLGQWYIRNKIDNPRSKL